MFSKYWVTNPFVFCGVFALLGMYLLYVIIRKPKKDRSGSEGREPEL
jgi:hypothetical protein